MANKDDDQGKRDRDGLDRRGFLRLVGGTAAALGAASCLPHVDGTWDSCEEEPFELDPALVPRSNRVVEVVASGSVAEDSLDIDAAVVAAMFAAGLTALTDAASAAAAWQQVLPDYQPGERISLKANALNPSVPSSPALVAAVGRSLVDEFEAVADDVYAWDRTEREMQRAGLVPEVLGIQVRGTHVSSSDESGAGYEEQTVCLSGRRIRLTRLLTQETDHLINLAVMKNHYAAGFTGCLKNHYGSFANPGDFHENCERHIARLNAMPEVAGTTRLHVMDALLGVSRGDTDKPADCKPRRILLAFDPVAIDQRGFELRDEMRAEAGLEPGNPAGYIAEAEALGLGTTTYDLVRIDL